MKSTKRKSSLTVLIGIGLIAGLIISAVDNYAFEGEVSPIVIVAMVFSITAVIGMIWSWKGWPASVILWIFIPLVHLIKHLLDLSDTLHPDTYMSILKLAGFTFLIASIGTGAGIIIRKLEMNTEADD